MSKLKSKLDQMINKAYLFDGKEELVLSHQFNDTSAVITIRTNKRDHLISFSDLNQKLAEILPIEMSPKTTTNNFTPSVTGEVIVDVKNILLDNIKKVQENKDYIPQAVEINSNVKSIIDLAKTEIEMVKTITKF